MAYAITNARKKQTRKAVTTGGLITFDQFYDIVEETVKADLLDGKILRDSPAVPEHGFTTMWLGALLHNFNEIFNLGKIGGGTTTVRLAKYQSPEPDLYKAPLSFMRIRTASGWRSSRMRRAVCSRKFFLGFG